MRRFLLCGLLLAACGDDDGALPSDGGGADSGDADGVLPPGNPILGDDRLTPFPSAYHMRDDETTATGVRVSLDSDDLPVSTEGVVTDPASFPQGDGFSPATPILVYFDEGVDPTNLPPIADLAASLDAKSPTAIVDMATGARVAHFAELDLNADPAKGQRRLLILRPAARLPAGGRIAVALTTALRDATGAPIERPPGMAALLAGEPSGDARVERLRARMPDVLAALSTAGVAEEDVAVAWDFVTATDDFIHAPVLAMRDEALAVIGDDASGVSYAVESVEDDFGGDDLTLRRVRGTFETPLWLTDGGEMEGVFVRGDDGLPELQGTYDPPFTLIVPARAATERPLPLLIWGHGLLGSGEDSVSDDLARGLAENYGYVIVGTDWTGLSTTDVPTIATALTDINRFARITDKLQQAIVNVIVLTRVARDRLRQDPDVMVGGEEVIDPARVFYNGNSLGGIMGAAMLGRAVDIERGVLGVPGCNWSLLIQRSSNWPLQEAIFGQTYPDPFDQVVLITLGQSQFDFSDPVNVAPHLVGDPLPGTPAKKLLLHAGVGDAQVANITTDLLARTLGVPLLAPSVIPVFGIGEEKAPLESALVYFDYGIEPPNLTTVAPAKDNVVHGSVREEPAAQRQLAGFLREDGTIASECGGACDCTKGSTACE